MGISMFLAIGIPTLFGLFHSQIQEVVFDISVNSITGGIVLFNTILWSANPWYLVAVYAVIAVIIGYHVYVFMEHRKNRVMRAEVTGTGKHIRRDG
jgi:protein-S-isoprenylcysteine O-methyltransferase Ste14